MQRIVEQWLAIKKDEPAAKSLTELNPDRLGPLQKRVESVNGGQSSWIPVKVIVKDYFLYYYEDKKEESTLLGVLLLKDSVVITETIFANAALHVICIIPKYPEALLEPRALSTQDLISRYYFTAETKEQMRDWQKVLQKASKCVILQEGSNVMGTEKEIGKDGKDRLYRTPTILGSILTDSFASLDSAKDPKTKRIIKRL